MSEGTYIVTGATYQKEPFFAGHDRLALLHDSLLEVAQLCAWRLEAWAVFPNHYHFVGRSPESEAGIAALINRLHATTSREINRHDSQAGRKVWFSYWQTKLTYEKSYLARLNYVHNNPVKHGLIQDAIQYPYCSAAWFSSSADPAWQKVVASFQTDKVNVPDDF